MPSALPITITFATPPEGTCPATFTEAVATLESLVEGNITTAFLPYILGSATPAVEDQNKAWIRTDSAGRPLGTFIFYAGSWRRQYTGKPAELAFFNGDPSLYFDGTGKGLTTAEWDGWALCNGNNGTPNLSDRFISGAHMDGSGGYPTRVGGAWVSEYNGTVAAVGGSPGLFIAPANLPALTVDINGNEYNPGGSAHPDARVIIDPLYQNPSPHTVTLATYGTATPTPMTNIPPYYAMAFCGWIGYS